MIEGEKGELTTELWDIRPTHETFIQSDIVTQIDREGSNLQISNNCVMSHRHKFASRHTQILFQLPSQFLVSDLCACQIQPKFAAIFRGTSITLFLAAQEAKLKVGLFAL